MDENRPHLAGQADEADAVGETQGIAPDYPLLVSHDSLRSRWSWSQWSRSPQLSLNIYFSSLNSASVKRLRGIWNTHHRHATDPGESLFVRMCNVDFVDTEALAFFIQFLNTLQFINTMGTTTLHLEWCDCRTTTSNGERIFITQQLQQIQHLRNLNFDLFGVPNNVYEGMFDLLSSPNLANLQEFAMEKVDEHEGFQDHILRGLQHSHFQLESLQLGGDAVNNARFERVVEALSLSNSAATLQTLTFSDFWLDGSNDFCLTMDSFASIARLLEAPFESLQKLSLTGMRSVFQNTSAESKEHYELFLNTLVRNTNLQVLTIQDCEFLNSDNAMMLFEALTVRKGLLRLGLGKRKTKEDEKHAVRALVECLPRIKTLETLSLGLEYDHPEVVGALRQNTSLLIYRPFLERAEPSLRRNKHLKRARSLLTEHGSQIQQANYCLCLRYIQDDEHEQDNNDEETDQNFEQDALFLFLTRTSNLIS